MTSISRQQGKLILNRAPATLRGGNYNLFLTPGSADKAIELARTDRPIIALHNGVDPCQRVGTDILAEMAHWTERENTFPELFKAMQDNHCNLVRLFLTGGSFGEDTLLPFISQKVGETIKYDVRGAVVEGRWNEKFFTRLRDFVTAADAAGVVVHLSLFNYFELEEDRGALKNWKLTPWRAANSLNPAWAATHLMPEIAAKEDRQRFFITPAAGNRLRAVQQELIGRTVKALAGLENVILEVMNEPHYTEDINKVVEFDSYMTGLIVRYRTQHGSKALISINAVNVKQGPWDVDVWRAGALPNFRHVDLVSYHGLTGYPPRKVRACCKPGDPTPCGVEVNAPRVDRDSVVERARLHFGTHPDTPMMYSTDAVRIGAFTHTYSGRLLSMEVRDGQIRVTPGPQPDLRAELVRTGVVQWASRCFEQARLRPGQVHFHNHSTFRASLEEIGKAVSIVPLVGVAVESPAAAEA